MTKNAFGKAVRYTLDQWIYRRRYLLDGRLEISNNRAERSIKPLGEIQAGLIKDTITRSPEWAEPNAPGTIAKKGLATPLVDSGQMSQSVHHVVVPKGSQE